jgi:hypothetical protein
MLGLLTGFCHLKECLFKLGLVNSPEFDKCKQASETAPHVLCDEVSALLRFRYLAHHLLQPGGFADTSTSKVLHFVQNAGLLNV